MAQMNIEDNDVIDVDHDDDDDDDEILDVKVLTFW